jgi:hypothetical protein
MIRQETGETTMHGPGEIFAADPAIETLVHVTNIGKTDRAFTVAVYTRDQFNGRKALEALNAAIADMLNQWNTDKYVLPPVVTLDKDDGQVDYRHYRVEWPIEGLAGHTGDRRITCSLRMPPSEAH